MLYKTLKKLVLTHGLTDEIRDKIDTLYALGRITIDQYRDLIGDE